METNKKTTDLSERGRLVVRYRFLGRLLANELAPESDAAPLRREREQVQAAIDAIDSKSGEIDSKSGEIDANEGK